MPAATVEWGASERIRRLPKGSQQGMRTKKPRSGKAVKPAARPVRRVPRGKPKTLRRRPSPAKAKGSKGKPPKKPKRIVKRKPRAAVKTKVVRKRVIRKPRAKASPIRLERAQKVAPIFTGPGVEAGAAPAAGVSREKTAQAEAGLSIPPILLEGDE